jgi:hypothetical protein
MKILWLLYVIGMLLHLALQIQISIRSSSNGLGTGWQGIVTWLKLNGLSVGIRFFFAIIFFPAFLEGPLVKLGETLASAGFKLPAWGLAGIAGYNADALGNQILALIPGLKTEMPLLVPPTQPPA